MVTKVARISRCVRVFDLTVGRNANLFANGVLVHNKKHDVAPLPQEMQGEWDGMSVWTGRACKLRLAQDRSGQFAVWDGWTERAQVWRISSWDIVGEKLVVRLEGDTGRLEGSCDARALRLDHFEGRRRIDSVIVRRVEDLERERADVRRAAASRQ